MRRRAIWMGMAAVTIAAALAVPAAAQGIKLVASDGQPGDRFGERMAADGDVAVVLSPGNGAYVFRRGGGGWAEEQKLTPNVLDSLFGTAVAVRADLVVVGAGDITESASGVAYVFRRSGGVWSQTGVLESIYNQQFDGFGTSMVMVGDTLAIGAPGFDPPSGPTCTGRGCPPFSPGGISIFENSGGGPFIHAQDIDGTDIPTGTWFPLALGVVLAGSGDSLVTLRGGALPGMLQFARPFVSAWYDFEAYSPNSAPVAVMDDGLLAQGRPGGDGRVRILWQTSAGGPFEMQQDVQASDAAFLNGFGASIDLDGGCLLVGSPGHDGVGPDAGAAYALLQSAPGAPFVEQHRQVPYDGAGGEEFGASVALTGTGALVGAPGAAGTRGAVYVIDGCDTATNGPPVADAGPDQVVEADCAGPGGSTAVLLDGSGSSDPDGDPLTFDWSGSSISTVSGEQTLVDLDLGTHVIDLTVEDGNGGTAGDSVTIDVADVTAPSIAAPPPLVVLASAIGADGRGQISAADPAVADWLASASVTDACDASVVLSQDAPAEFPAGTTTVTFSASDASGNGATAASTVQVIYGFGGFEPPLLADNSASIKQGKNGRTIPVKFAASSGPMAASGIVATISVFRIVDVATGSTDTTDLTADSGSSGDSGNVFRYDPLDEHYIFNLSTRGFEADATYRIVVSLDDGTTHTVDFSLR